MGAVFMLYHKNRRIHTESIHIAATSTFFQAGIKVINHTCQFTLAHLPDHNMSYIEILLSDSEATIKALKQPRILSQSVLTKFEHIETLGSQVKHLTLAWIEAHVGTEGNEQADQAAKECAGGEAYIKQ